MGSQAVTLGTARETWQGCARGLVTPSLRRAPASCGKEGSFVGVNTTHAHKQSETKIHRHRHTPSVSLLSGWRNHLGGSVHLDEEKHGKLKRRRGVGLCRNNTQTHRHTDTHRQTQTHNHTRTDTDTQTHRHIDRQTDRQHTKEVKLSASLRQGTDSGSAAAVGTT